MFKMKSKSFDLGHASGDKLEQNRSFDFINLYKSAADSSTPLPEKSSNVYNHDQASHNTSESFSREKSNKRRKDKREPIAITHLTIDDPNLTNSVGGGTPLNESKLTSTPLGIRKNLKAPKVKSIMKVKSSPSITDVIDTSLEFSNSKPKKRNKSVSFMLEDSEEVITKKTKSDDSASDTKSDQALLKNKSKKHFKKAKKDQQAEKENHVETNQSSKEIEVDDKANKKSKSHKKSVKVTADVPSTTESTISVPVTVNGNEGKKKRKHLKKTKKSLVNSEDKKVDASSASLGTPPEYVKQAKEKVKIPKKKNHQEKLDLEGEEPKTKSRKKDEKPDVVADLENLSIGDNAHTISNLLDEMTVVDKEKRKKLKQKFNKNKKPKGPVKMEKSEAVENGVDKDKKWRRRKWNKDTKDLNEESLETTVIVENLPLSILFTYKKLLAEHFVKYGLIKSVGIAEVYPTEISKPVFTTTVNFYSDGAAIEALKEDKTTFEGSRIKVKRPLPPTETTLVVRSYGALTTQFLSSVFHSAGRIRNIRHTVKGKHAMSTFFIEFDGPESTERALKLATDVKIGGKKMYVSRFESRPKKPKPEKTNDQASDADQSEDSQS